MCASSPPPIATWKPNIAQELSARISISGLNVVTVALAVAARASLRYSRAGRTGFSTRYAPDARSGDQRGHEIVCCNTTGRAMFANWKTASNARSRWAIGKIIDLE